MFRPATRSLLRSAQSSLRPSATPLSARRFLTTAPPHKVSRSWKNSAARWGIAIAGIYFYNTSSIFAQDPSTNLLHPNLEPVEESPLNLDALASSKKNPPKPSAAEETFARTSTENASTTSTTATTTSRTEAPESSAPSSNISSMDPSATPAELEEEASAEGAFNPVTGEINWDCPCLGGMAHGPCGDEFKAAFSCFVFSQEEPKGMECIDKFQGMQNCFREHPDVYKGELEGDDDEELDEGLLAERASLEKEVEERKAAVKQKKQQSQTKSADAKRLLDDSPPSERVPLRKSKRSSSTPKTSSSTEQKEGQQQQKAKIPKPSSSEPHPGMSEDHDVATAAASVQQPQTSSKKHSSDDKKIKEQKLFDEDLELVPKEWHDTREASSPGLGNGK